MVASACLSIPFMSLQYCDCTKCIRFASFSRSPCNHVYHVIVPHKVKMFPLVRFACLLLPPPLRSISISPFSRCTECECICRRMKQMPLSVSYFFRWLKSAEIRRAEERRVPWRASRNRMQANECIKMFAEFLYSSFGASGSAGRAINYFHLSVILRRCERAISPLGFSAIVLAAHS